MKELHAAQRDGRGVEGLRVVALTAEPQDEADRAKLDWGISGDDFEFVGAPDNEMALYLRAEHLPGLEIVGPGSPLPNPYGGFEGNKSHPRLSSQELYPRGCLQPSILILSPTDNGSGAVALYRWTVGSSLSNMGGASGRPLWKHMLGTAKSQILKVEKGEDVVVIEGDVGWERTARDFITCLFKAPLAAFEYAKGSKAKSEAKPKEQ